MGQRRRRFSEAFRVCREETRKHNRQREPPVRRAGAGPARLRHRQLCLQDDEAMKPYEVSSGAAHVWNSSSVIGVSLARTP